MEAVVGAPRHFSFHKVVPSGNSCKLFIGQLEFRPVPTIKELEDPGVIPLCHVVIPPALWAHPFGGKLRGQYLLGRNIAILALGSLPHQPRVDTIVHFPKPQGKLRPRRVNAGNPDVDFRMKSVAMVVPASIIHPQKVCAAYITAKKVRHEAANSLSHVVRGHKTAPVEAIHFMLVLGGTDCQDVKEIPVPRDHGLDRKSIRNLTCMQFQPQG